MADYSLSELSTARRFIYATLSGDETLKQPVDGLVVTDIGRAPLSPGDGEVYIAYSLASPGADERALCGATAFVRPLFRVAVVGRGTGTEALDPFARRVDELLNNTRQAAGDGPELECVRESPFEQDFTDATGNRFTLVGGFYRFTLIP